MLTTKSEAFQNVITNLTNAHKIELQNQALKVLNLTNERMSELFDYGFNYKGEVKLGELTLEEYAEIIVPERTKFRIKELESLGFIESVSSKEYGYIPNENIILCSCREDSVRSMNNENWQALLNFYKTQIKNYQEPTPVNDIKVVESKENEPIKLNSNEIKIIEESVKITEMPKVYEVEVPQQLGNIDFSKLLEEVNYYISELAKPEENRNLKDSEQYIFESAVTAIYGQQIWDFVNSRIE